MDLSRFPRRFVIEERVPGSYSSTASGNNFMFNLMGVEAIDVVPGGSNMAQAMPKNGRRSGRSRGQGLHHSGRWLQRFRGLGLCGLRTRVATAIF